MSHCGVTNSRIALCLSGGGLRATLFHLGVIKALRRHRVADRMTLELVDEIYSVSGGSILAAHMLANWARYIEPDEAVFAEVEREIRQFAALNIRDRIIRRWFLTRWIGVTIGLLTRIPFIRAVYGSRTGLFSRTYWLQKQYEHDKLVGKLCLGEATARGTSSPKFHFLTTSFKTGELCSFTGDSFEIEKRDPDSSEPPTTLLAVTPTPCGHLRLSFAVAASSAFPPMFPPIAITDDQLANPKNEAFLNAISLSDGGVYDNLGIEKFRRNMARNSDHPRKLIISDAGGSFRASAEKSYDHLIARNVRASDILMHRVGDKLKADIRSLDTVDDVTIRISDTVAAANVDEAVQQRLRLVRTDLDRFDQPLADLLIGHGERLAGPQLRDLFHSDAIAPEPVVTPISEVTARLDDLARRSASRSFGSLLVGKDWVVPLFVPAFLVVAATPIGLSSYSIVKFIETGNQARESQREADNQRAQALIQRERNLESGKAFDQLRASCLDKQLPCKREDYGKLAASLDRALEGAAAAVDDTETAAIYTGEAASAPPPLAGQATNQPVFDQKVFVQFAGRIKREEMDALYGGLRAQGWNMQGPTGQRIGIAANLNEVRYSAVRNKPAAEKLAAAVTQAGIVTAKVRAVQNRIIQRDTLEVWISR